MITPFTTPNELASYLGTTYSKLAYVVYGIGVDSLYETFEIAKKNGDKRVIRAPNLQLKTLQGRLKILLERMYEPHPAATAFIAGRGIVYNASKHVKKSAVFNIDLEGFYDQIHFGRVRGLLMAKPYSVQQDTARLIAHICCVDRVLPQGAPTSPVLSNMICRRMDKELSFLAKRNRAHYSRYADDITFSLRESTENSLFIGSGEEVKPSETLLGVVESNGFSVNKYKTRLQTYSERQVVTGLKVNKKVNLDRRYIRTTRAMIHSLAKGLDLANDKYRRKFGEESCKVEYVTFGRLNFIGMVKGRDSTVYQTLANKFNGLDISLKANTAPDQRDLKLENKLHFYSYQGKSRLENCVWVVSFDGVENIGDGELIQGTAFIMKGQRIFTASHIFEKAGNPDACFLYRVHSPDKKYKASVVTKCTHSDITELKIDEDNLPMFNYLNFAPNIDPHVGYRLSIVGFPQLQVGHDSVSIIQTSVTNTFTRSTFRYGEVDVPIMAGNSGGPVLNAYMQVVGMATTGVDVTYFKEEVNHAGSEKEKVHVALEGTNAFISAKHFPNFGKG